MRNRGTLIFLVAILLISFSRASAFAQSVIGMPVAEGQTKAPLVTTVQQPKAITASGAGTGTIATGSCSTLTCNSGDICNCWQASVPVTPTGIGKSTLAFSLNNDTNPLVNNGSNGVCEPMSGTGTITKKNGDLANLQIGGSLCVVGGSVPPVMFTGNFTMIGGTGSLAAATGTGVFSFTDDSINLGSANFIATMTGAFLK